MSFNECSLPGDNLMQGYYNRKKVRPNFQHYSRPESTWVHGWKTTGHVSTSAFADTDLWHESYHEDALPHAEEDTLTPGREGHPVASALIALGISIVAIWSATLLPKHVMTAVEARTVNARPALQVNLSQEKPEELPSLDARVVAGMLVRYHWHDDCPLASAHTLRDRPPARRELHVSRREAELKGWLPCQYCLDIKLWRRKQAEGAAPAGRSRFAHRGH